MERLIEFLQPRRALLVLDNCEHLLPEVGRLVTTVIARTPSVDVLATSRERLGAEGEQLIPLGPLATPAWDDPAGPSVLLFADRARAVRPEITLGDDEIPAVCELCRRLDGLPLAIELAAAQTMSMAPTEILEAVADRLTELADGRRVVERHRSLDAVFGWSYERLDGTEKEVFERLAVFVGGWTASAAQEVADASPADLAALVERSLVVAQPGDGGTRFTMLEPVRQYATARLEERGSLPEVHARHASWAVGFAEEAGAGVCGPDEIAWLRAWDAEFANLRAAYRWCLDNDAIGSIRLAGSLYHYIRVGAPSETFAWAEEAVSRFPDVSHPR
ncbi:MAG: ATP-binding protein, partial [Candidatus Binatia bacterium]